MGFGAMLEALKGVNLTLLTADAITANPVAVLDANKAQLMEGLGVDDRPLGPKFSADPYFKSPASAKSYADFKARVTPQTPYDTPNYFIKGDTHNAMYLTVNGTTFSVRTGVSWGNKIDPKTGGQAFGLSVDDSRTLYNTTYSPVVMAGIKSQYGFK